MTKVTASEVRDRFRHGDDFNVAVVDARSDHAWAESDMKAHNAVRIPPDDDVEKYVSKLDRNDYIVIYCT